MIKGGHKQKIVLASMLAVQLLAQNAALADLTGWQKNAIAARNAARYKQWDATENYLMAAINEIHRLQLHRIQLPIDYPTLQCIAEMSRIAVTWRTAVREKETGIVEHPPVATKSNAAKSNAKKETKPAQNTKQISKTDETSKVEVDNKDDKKDEKKEEKKEEKNNDSTAANPDETKSASQSEKSSDAKTDEDTAASSKLLSPEAEQKLTKTIARLSKDVNVVGSVLKFDSTYLGANNPVTIDANRFLARSSIELKEQEDIRRANVLEKQRLQEEQANQTGQ
jgi:outer membrane biosynthesis protein TonB